jgi:hypothetical protein
MSEAGLDDQQKPPPRRTKSWRELAAVSERTEAAVEELCAKLSRDQIAELREFLAAEDDERRH